MTTTTRPTAYDELAALAPERAKASGKTFEQEFSEVLAADRELRAHYAADQRAEERAEDRRQLDDARVARSPAPVHFAVPYGMAMVKVWS